MAFQGMSPLLYVSRCPTTMSRLIVTYDLWHATHRWQVPVPDDALDLGHVLEPLHQRLAVCMPLALAGELDA